jgi:hypothetical protein
MDKRAFQLAKEICDFLMDRSKKPNCYDGQPPYDDFAYGSAVADWERRGQKVKAWFSTQDPHMLHYKEALSLRFKLPVVTREEGLQRAKVQKTKTKIVTEANWLHDLGIVDPFGKELGGPE